MIDLHGKTVLVTGGTGSFGNALIDYLSDSGAHFIVYSRDETKQYDMYTTRRDKNISYVIGDVRDKDKLIRSMRGVDYVFHAAALKQVPTGERFPEEVVATNVQGTRNVLEAADQCGVERVIVLSTDKAAFPIGTYGMSKAIAERIVSAFTGDVVSVCLRYGNVLGSRGSIIPLFLGFIEQGRPLTITNLAMTRFILTLEEAVKVALKCLNDGENGELFVMRPPACSLETVVEALEMHFGTGFKKDIIGIRAGEKMHETLLTGAEVHRAVEEEEDGIRYARLATRYPTDYHFQGEDYVEPEPFTSQNAEQLTAEEVLYKLMEARLL